MLSHNTNEQILGLDKNYFYYWNCSWIFGLVHIDMGAYYRHLSKCHSAVWKQLVQSIWALFFCLFELIVFGKETCFIWDEGRICCAGSSTVKCIKIYILCITPETLKKPTKFLRLLGEKGLFLPCWRKMDILFYARWIQLPSTIAFALFFIFKEHLIELA